MMRSTQTDERKVLMSIQYVNSLNLTLNTEGLTKRPYQRLTVFV